MTLLKVNLYLNMSPANNDRLVSWFHNLCHGFIIRTLYFFFIGKLSRAVNLESNWCFWCEYNGRGNLRRKDFVFLSVRCFL